MTNKQFESLFEKTVKRDRETLVYKATVYARGDRLSNFKKAALCLECTNERALEGMLSKHLTAIHDFIKDLDANTTASLEQWQEKIGDARNYLLLLEALITERIEKEKL